MRTIKLVMYLGNETIDIIPISSGKVKISNFIKELKQTHKETIQNTENEPKFYIENIPSQINSFTSLKVPNLIRNNKLIKAKV